MLPENSLVSDWNALSLFSSVHIAVGSCPTPGHSIFSPYSAVVFVLKTEL